MKKIILITSTFPYDSREQFLETEVEYFCADKELRFSILPIFHGNGVKRSVPSCIKLHEALLEARSNTLRMRVFYLISALRNKYFYKELFSENLLSFMKIKYFFLAISRYEMFYQKFDRLLSKEDDLDNTIIYTYWHTEATYALQSLRKKYDYKLVSRIHGSDLYREAKPCGYMPLKKYFTNNIDKIFTITPSANSYLCENYRFDENILELSRLGVKDHSIVSSSSNSNSLHIVSCSFMVEVKQIHKILEALEIISKKLSHINFKWTHIGDGPLYENLVGLAEKRPENIANIHYDFVGNLDNSAVYEFYKNNQVDVFLNVSKSEGVPVSIMEAMSCHIPIIAPNVGGVHDMVIDNFNGCLLSKECEVDEIVNALKNIDFLKNTIIRENAYNVFFEKYNAKINYMNFIKSIAKLDNR